jgi:hypothetical protein
MLLSTFKSPSLKRQAFDAGFFSRERKPALSGVSHTVS